LLLCHLAKKFIRAGGTIASKASVRTSELNFETNDRARNKNRADYPLERMPL
jgi:hypothetical protein